MGQSKLKRGETITAIGYRFSDGKPILPLKKTAIASGKEMFLYGRGGKANYSIHHELTRVFRARRHVALVD